MGVDKDMLNRYTRQQIFCKQTYRTLKTNESVH